MTDELKLKAYAKINLGLDVTGLRDDGYHLVKMIMQSINLYDLVTLRKTDKEGIFLTTNLNFLPVNESNIAYKAAKVLMDKYPDKIKGIEIDIKKSIPVSAGMAGGSTNAASVLYGMNKLFDLGLKIPELMKIALPLGADVPFCLLRGTVLAEGIGEKLTRITAMPKCSILVAKPGFGVSTKTVYKDLDSIENPPHPDIDLLMKDLDNQDVYSLSSHLGNILESVTVPSHPVINELKELMIDMGALGSLMSGSGPTVYGIFDDIDKCKAAKYEILNKKITKQVFVTRPFNVG